MAPAARVELAANALGSGADEADNAGEAENKVDREPSSPEIERAN